MLFTTRFDGRPGPNPTTRTALPPPLKPQAPVGDQPVGHRGEGPLTRLVHRLRVTPNGCSTALFSAVTQTGEAPHGLRTPAATGLRQPQHEGDAPAGKLLRRRQRTVNATGGAGPVGATSDAVAHRHARAVESLRRRFAGPGVDTLLAGLMDLATPPSLAFERPLLVGCVLARMTGGDARRAAGLLQGLRAVEPTGAAYALQRALARCGGVGIDCLMALDPPAVAGGDPAPGPVQREAYAARWRAADAIAHLLPPHLQPHSLADCVRRAAADGPPLVDNRVLVDGLACAQALVDNPAAEVRQPLRAAYLALRNGLLTPGQVKRAQERLFKINTYIDRASERGTTRAVHAVQRLFGYQKSPLHALTQLGTAQSKTRHPEDDLAARTVVMDAFVARLETVQAGRRRVALPADDTVRRAVRIAAVRQWKQRVVDRAWRDDIRVGRRWRAAIAADAAAQLGCPLERLHPDPTLKGLRCLCADLLVKWSAEEDIDVREPVVPGDPRSYGAALARMCAMQNDGDVVLRRPDPVQTRHLLHHAIADTRQTYSVTFNQSCSMGLQGSVTDILALTPVVLGVGPGIAALHGRAAYLVGGSNVHGGQLQVGSQRSARVEAGVVAFVGKRVGDLVNLGLTGSLMPLQLEHSRTRATVLRTRMNVGGTDKPTAWMDLLLDAYDAITWKDGEAGPPTDAAAMWQQLARRFYKNPALSIDDLQARQTSAAGSAAAVLGARLGIGSGVQVGPTATLGASLVFRNRFRQKDGGANRSTEQNTDSGVRGGTASLGLTGVAPSITGGEIADHAAEPGATQALALTSANLGGCSVGLLRNAAGVTVRLVTDQGRIDPDYSVMDTECGAAASFARYIDTQRADWLAALGGDAAATQALDVFLTRLVNEERRGNVTYGERRRMTPLAARRVDFFRAMLVAMRDTGGQADAGAAGEIERLEGEVSRVLNDPVSWDARSLWALDLGQQSTAKGPSIILQLVSRKTVSAPRQRAVLVAGQAPHRALEEGHIG
ncbi:hypothetical protein GN316_16015 [Xylophilus sp. Kf1]|nr:hypothetical protein [Xylophilus sp. Kf1]